MGSRLKTYRRFGLMIAVSMMVMFGLMYLNTYAVAHVHWSETRAYMTLIMGAGMAVVMLLFMPDMYDDRALNMTILASAVALFVLSLWLVRSQRTVQDSAYMRGMIPHHSIAILTSERADIRDLRVRALADGILEAQKREIREMEWLIDDIAANGPALDRGQADARPMPAFGSP